MTINASLMTTNTSLDRHAWRPWTVQLPAAIATAECFFLGTIGWLYVELITAIKCAMTDGSPGPGCNPASSWWLAAGGLVQGALAAAVITVGIRSRKRPGFRPSGAIACWLAIPLAAGWFALCLMNSQR
jgi:hypothetical protein